ncbi:MAG: RluA family pseudouridine synthase [Bacteroidales bacterium]|nr:RluA family pseudouridine synthase [Bacteroidales bacterium]
MKEEVNEITESGELYEHHRIEVDKGQGVLRIDKFLFDRLENVSRSKIQAAAHSGNIIVNEKAVKPNYKVKPRDTISIVLPHPPHEFEIIPEDIPVNIIYEDDELIVVNKEAGMVVHPGHGNYTGTLVNALTYHLKDLPLFQQGEMRPGLVHRIDKNTSGLLVVAKTEKALNHLARQFYERTTHRRYVAIVWGSFDEEEGTITGNIARHLTNRMKMDVFPDGDHGKHAITHYKVLERFDYTSVVECRLETGRTHQIRVHMEYMKHPIFNDERYGGDQILRGTTFTKYKQFVDNCFKIMPRHALHAKSLGFVHPTSGKEMKFESELPADMNEVILKWRRYTDSRS